MFDRKCPEDEYYEIDRGIFDVYLMKASGNREVAFSDGNYVFLGIGYTDEDVNAVIQFAKQYDAEIVWEV